MLIYVILYIIKFNIFSVEDSFLGKLQSATLATGEVIRGNNTGEAEAKQN
jgi:hypothetical protein